MFGIQKKYQLDFYKKTAKVPLPRNQFKSAHAKIPNLAAEY